MQCPNELGSDPAGEQLVDWIRRNGGTVRVKVGPVPGSGLRGLMAVEDIPAGESAIAVPAGLCVQLGSAASQGAELAVDVLRLRLGDPAWTARLAPYWASLPAQGSLLSKEAWSADHLDVLQDAGLAEFVMHNTDYTDEVVFPELAERLRGFPGVESVTPEEFRHWASLVAQYSFVFWNSTGEDRAQRRFLFPLGDLANHKGASNSAAELDHTRSELVLVATRNIQAGEEVTHTYSRENERNDYSLVNYFFTQELDPPRLCALDLPGEHAEDDDLGGPDSAYFGSHPDELEVQAYRLEQRLMSFPTTPEQDAVLLAKSGPSALSAVPRQIVAFRMLRKRALQAMAEEIKARAAKARGGAGGPAEDLIFWIRDSGGQAHVEIGPVNAAGLRGTLAARDFVPGDVIISVPFNLTVAIGGHSSLASELAVQLLRQRLERPGHWAALAPYWASLPPAHALYCKELALPHHAAELQDALLALEFISNAAASESVFRGNAEGIAPEHQFPSLASLPGAAQLSRADFHEAVKWVALYSFTFDDEAGELTRYLLPLLDLVNHRGDANAHVTRHAGTGAFRLEALTDIKRGEEMTHCYDERYERPDFALVNSFFLPGHGEDLLAAVDLPGGTLDGGPYPAPDSAHFPMWSLEREAERLADRLKAFPTSEAQDAALLRRRRGWLGLAWRRPPDAVALRIIEFRLRRKRALRRMVRELRDRLDNIHRRLASGGAALGRELRR
ncbi:hypothetical protein WJX81_006882 [Elliptochloris bilobata]|uniref:SET domain-containing protein n=1 Tax=Elliptochloris bilobata TaxID=381761 RepID=A0AAW1SHW1_9CHLO